MALSYNVETVAFALGVSSKWVDNLLSKHDLPGVSKTKQGVERRITDAGVLALESTRLLAEDLGLPLKQAVTLARVALESRLAAEAVFVAPSGVTIHIPVDRIQERLRIQILAAIEAVPNRMRGRPRRDGRKNRSAGR